MGAADQRRSDHPGETVGLWPWAAPRAWSTWLDTHSPLSPIEGWAVRSHAGTAAAVVSLLCVAGVAALVRWSLWWQHSDMRQIWATAGASTLAVAGLAAFIAALVHLSSRGRLLFVFLVLLATVFGTLVGFAILESATARFR